MGKWSLRLLALVGVLLWVFSSGPWQAPVMWLVLGYLVWRAAPSIGSDVARVRRALPARRKGRYSARGGVL